jgi:hypothetical protein
VAPPTIFRHGGKENKSAHVSMEILPPFSWLRNNLTKQQAVLLVCFAYCVTFKMEAVLY